MKKYRVYIDLKKNGEGATVLGTKNGGLTYFESITVIVTDQPDPFTASEQAIKTVHEALPGFKTKNFQVFEN